jgi:hypothetical protein
MSKSNRENLPRVNFFDGQRVTETDLDTEQIHFRALTSNVILDFHKNGVVKDGTFESRVLLDTGLPGEYADEENPSRELLTSGAFDGFAVNLDQQPSDPVYGSRIEVTAEGLILGGRTKASLLILGLRFSATKTNGELVTEVLDFDKNQTKLSRNYYTRVIAVYFNNFSGGTGRTETSAQKDSLRTISDGGKFILRESEPLKVFSRTASFEQIESPNYSLSNFITSSAEKRIEDELRSALGTKYNFNELYFELESSKEFLFEPFADNTISYGQKFLSKITNIQRVDILLSVSSDDKVRSEDRFDFSGELVFSIHRLKDDISCVTDPSPDNLIDFDPDSSPIVEVSYSQEDLQDIGIKLSDIPQVVGVDFSNTLIADPNIDPSLGTDEFYAFIVSRRGGNSKGTVVISAGYYKPSRKSSNGQDLNPEEQFSRQSYRFIEFDPANSSYVDYHDLSMWIVIHSDTVEVTDGQAYSDDGFPISLPKVVDYVGSTKIPLFTKDIPLSSVAYGDKNYVVLHRQDKFTSPSTHPRTGNFVNTKIEDYPSFSVLTETALEGILDEAPLLLSRVIDNNVRDAQSVYGSFDRPGQIRRDHILIINPSSELLSNNLIGRIIVPDKDCSCNSRYRVIGQECLVVSLGDLDGDGSFTSSDISAVLELVGNTINAPTTERKILGGEIDLIDFIKSDLNVDGTIDGEDIELIEDAVDGYVNFSGEERVNVLKIRVENILSENDFPKIISTSDNPSSSGSGTTLAGSSEVTFLVSSEEEGLAIRIGDHVDISSDSIDSGTYTISSKVFDPDLLQVTVSVYLKLDGDILFSGSSGFDLLISSGTSVNMLADNTKLLSVPYSEKNWEIIHSSSSHLESNIEVCDIRRFVETNIIERYQGSCICEEEECIQPEVCGPILRNQKILPNDLYIPDGEIYTSPGVPYHGDFEFANISIPLPPGSIDDCSIDLYTNFIKAYAGTCKTASGYPAMVYSDGTYVGCQDSGGETDISKGRVKISQCIASLHVDAFVDGYAADGYADESDSTTASEVILESFEDHSYPNSLGFSEWQTVDPSSSTYFSISTPASANSPATFLLETISSGERTAGIEYPVSMVGSISGDFVLDFTAERSSWPDASMTSGQIKFFSNVKITNSDGTSTSLNLGWRFIHGGKTELFYSGEIFQTSTGTVISDFDRSIEALDDLGDVISFRIRRTNEAVFGMYYDKTLIDESSIDGKFIKIGSAPSLIPGPGDADINFYMQQALNPNAGQIFSGKIHTATIMHSFASDDITDEAVVELSRDSGSIINRATFGFPMLLNQRTNIVSAYMEITTASDYSGSDSFNIIPMEVLNADNLGRIIDYPLTENNSIITSFSPGPLIAGESLQIDVTPMAVYFLSRTGHLPGFIKAVVIEPSSGAVSELFLENKVSLVIEYEDITSGVIFKVGASMNSLTGIVSFSTKNILYDTVNSANRTILNFGVFLKKSGFKNSDVVIGIKDLDKLGIGTCKDETVFDSDELCFFVTGDTATGTFVQGPFPCFFNLP